MSALIIPPAFTGADADFANQYRQYHATIMSSAYTSGIIDAAYTRYGVFIYPGTSFVRPLTKWYFQLNTNGSTGAIQLYDVTAAKVVAEVTGVVTSYPVITLKTGLANIPTTTNLFEIQVKRTTGATIMYLWDSWIE